MPGFLDYYHPFFQDIEACMNTDCMLLHTAWMPSSVRLLFFLFHYNFFCQKNLNLTNFSPMWQSKLSFGLYVAKL